MTTITSVKTDPLGYNELLKSTHVSKEESLKLANDSMGNRVKYHEEGFMNFIQNRKTVHYGAAGTLTQEYKTGSEVEILLNSRHFIDPTNSYLQFEFKTAADGSAVDSTNAAYMRLNGPIHGIFARISLESDAGTELCVNPEPQVICNVQSAMTQSDDYRYTKGAISGHFRNHERTYTPVVVAETVNAAAAYGGTSSSAATTSTLIYAVADDAKAAKSIYDATYHQFQIPLSELGLGLFSTHKLLPLMLMGPVRLRLLLNTDAIAFKHGASSTNTMATKGYAIVADEIEFVSTINAAFKARVKELTDQKKGYVLQYDSWDRVQQASVATRDGSFDINLKKSNVKMVFSAIRPDGYKAAASDAALLSIEQARYGSGADGDAAAKIAAAALANWYYVVGSDNVPQRPIKDPRQTYNEAIRAWAHYSDSNVACVSYTDFLAKYFHFAVNLQKDDKITHSGLDTKASTNSLKFYIDFGKAPAGHTICSYVHYTNELRIFAEGILQKSE